MALWNVPKIWDGGECWIIGGGTSVPRQFGVPEEVILKVMTGAPASEYSPYLSPIHKKHVIGINNAYKIGDWLDVIFFGDCAWYVMHKENLAKINRLKVTCCDRFAKPDALCEGIKYLAKDKTKNLGISNNPSLVCWNNNSGAAAISLAAHFGVKRIVLLGFDMNLDEKRVSHWHGSHNTSPSRVLGKNVKIPPFARHLKGFPQIAADAKARGIEILNASPISAIQDFPKVNAKDYF